MISVNRRTFLGTFAAGSLSGATAKWDVGQFDRPRILRNARLYLEEKPITVTAAHSDRSAGGLHDFFSEGDYWWPDPRNPNGPYVQQDGVTNPTNFNEHRKYLMRLSVQMPALTAAWKVTKEKRYADPAAAHIRAWFINEETRMNPNLEFAQAIHGRSTGRGIGIIDTIHLVEVAHAIPSLIESGSLSQSEYQAVQRWFAEYLRWLLESEHGMAERDAQNNHGTCWLMQVAAFARLTGRSELLTYAANRFKTVIVPQQIESDGRMPLELKRTKPYGYCLFNLEALATLCQIVSEAGFDLWNFKTEDGRGIGKALAYMFPYIQNKSRWPERPDVMYYDDWPMRQESLLFGGLALRRPEYLQVWKKLPADSEVEEVIRNFFIRQPALWVGETNVSIAQELAVIL
jgi:hypothetical protein